MSRELSQEVRYMGNLGQGIEDRALARGIKQGLEQGIFSAIRTLMETQQFSEEEAMNALKLSLEDQIKYGKMIRQLKKTE